MPSCSGRRKTSFFAEIAIGMRITPGAPATVVGVSATNGMFDMSLSWSAKTQSNAAPWSLVGPNATLFVWSVTTVMSKMMFGVSSCWTTLTADSMSPNACCASAAYVPVGAFVMLMLTTASLIGTALRAIVGHDASTVSACVMAKLSPLFLKTRYSGLVSMMAPVG